jgi:preprotein translocase subunit YajC
MELIVIAVLFIGVFWFMNGKARKQQAAAFAFRDNLQPGQEVMTIGRMYGIVVEVNEDRVTLELSDGVVGVWDKQGIMRLVEPPLDDTDLEDDELDEDEYDDEYDDDEEYDDEALDDQLDELDAELDDAADVTENDGAEPVGGAIYDPAVVDETVDDATAADEVKTDEDWSDVDVPDDASSLIDPDTDEKKKPL